jgi:hypothetical protein
MRPLVPLRYGRLSELLSDLDLFEIMDRSGASVSKRSGDGRELGHGHGRGALHTVWAEAALRSKAAKEEAHRAVERAKEDLKRPKLVPPKLEPPKPVRPRDKKAAAAAAAAAAPTPKSAVVEAEAAAAAAVVVDMGESYLRAVRRLQARFGAEHAAAAAAAASASAAAAVPGSCGGPSPTPSLGGGHGGALHVESSWPITHNL